MNPKVSIILPTYQRVDLLRGVVENLLGQTLQDTEVIVVDDGSSDGTAEAMRAITDPRLRYLAPGRLGVPAIVNHGFATARGDYVIICHDHDDYEPTMLAQFAAFLDTHPSVAYVFSGLTLCSVDGTTELQQERHPFPSVTPGLEFLRRQLLPRLDSCIGVFTMIRHNALQGTYLAPEVGGCADVELWHRLCLAGDVGYIPDPLIHVRGRDPLSQFFLAEADLTARLLRAKARYLVHAENDAARAGIRRHWRAEANRAVLSNLYKCLRAGNLTAVPSIRTLAAEQAGPATRLALSLLLGLPERVSLATLDLLRSARHAGSS